ncbi:MAG: hypothetical protein U0Y82_00635 [Thermoleophilia bacterium]
MSAMRLAVSVALMLGALGAGSAAAAPWSPPVRVSTSDDEAIDTTPVVLGVGALPGGGTTVALQGGLGVRVGLLGAGGTKTGDPVTVDGSQYGAAAAVSNVNGVSLFLYGHPDGGVFAAFRRQDGSVQAFPTPIVATSANESVMAVAGAIDAHANALALVSVVKEDAHEHVIGGRVQLVRFRVGPGWSAPVTLVSSVEPAMGQMDVTLNDFGQGSVAWLAHRAGKRVVVQTARVTLSPGPVHVRSTAALRGDPCALNLAAGQTGAPLVAWSVTSSSCYGGATVWAARMAASGALGSQTNLGPAYGPLSAGSDAVGNATVGWLDPKGRVKLHQAPAGAASGTQTTLWQPSRRKGQTGASQLRVAVDGVGDTVVGWSPEVNDGEFTRVVAAVRPAGGRFGSVEPVGDGGDSRSSGPLQLTIGPDGITRAAWTEGAGNCCGSVEAGVRKPLPRVTASSLVIAGSGAAARASFRLSAAGVVQVTLTGDGAIPHGTAVLVRGHAGRNALRLGPVVKGLPAGTYHVVVGPASGGLYATQPTATLVVGG